MIIHGHYRCVIISGFILNMKPHPWHYKYNIWLYTKIENFWLGFSKKLDEFLLSRWGIKSSVENFSRSLLSECAFACMMRPEASKVFKIKILGERMFSKKLDEFLLARIFFSFFQQCFVLFFNLRFYTNMFWHVKHLNLLFLP